MKPSIPKGTRDFTPVEAARRNYIFDTIKDVFAVYGYRQIETPAMETLQTLMGKYSEEGDKLLYKILNSGDFLKGIDPAELTTEGSATRLAAKICDKGLRYDLTVPFARFVVMHRQELQFPFKRYQIQPVWRADRPQKGRYREFYQCDADVVGSDSLLYEVELLQMIDEVFSRFGVRVCIKLNNRKVLAGIAEYIGEPERLADITVAIDKIDKIGLEKVNEELAERGLSAEAIAKLTPVLALSGTPAERLDALQHLLKDSATGLKGVEELRYVISKTEALGLDAELELDVALARGLNYYTGCIIEVKAKDVAIGSISGGGRYDNLTGIFGLPGVSGVGISFGADRIYDVLAQLGLFPESLSSATRLLLVNFGGEEEMTALKTLKDVRRAGVSAELYPEPAKMKKQMKYADDMSIPFVALIGTEEASAGEATLRSMSDGTQKRVALSDLAAAVR